MAGDRVRFQEQLDAWPGIGQRRMTDTAVRGRVGMPGQLPGIVVPPNSVPPASTQTGVVDMAAFPTFNGDKSLSLLTTSQLIIAAPPVGVARNALMFRNTDAAATVYVGIGSDASTLSTLALAPGEIMLFDVRVPQDDIYALASVAAAVLAFSWSNYTLPLVG